MLRSERQLVDGQILNGWLEVVRGDNTQLFTSKAAVPETRSRHTGSDLLPIPGYSSSPPSPFVGNWSTRAFDVGHVQRAHYDINSIVMETQQPNSSIHEVRSALSKFKVTTRSRENAIPIRSLSSPYANLAHRLSISSL